MKRRPDWPERLARVVTGWGQRPFVWGTGDCVCFAGAVVEALTGADLLMGWRGRYASAAEAGRLLNGKLEDAVTAVLGEALPVRLARRGDLVMVRGGLGVCLGAAAAVRARQAGLLFVPMREVGRSWKI